LGKAIMRDIGKRLLVAAIGAGIIGAGAAGAQAIAEDPYIWLEDVYSPRAMTWVEAHNAKTLARLESDSRYAGYYADALAIAEAKDRIPVGSFRGDYVYNFWQDADHIRGVWRRATTASYATLNPAWETVLDLDAFAASEKANWVWKGADCARPAERLCLVSLSDGGEDAVTVREFDLQSKTFVPGGFTLAKGKQDIAWEDENTLLISREWTPGDLTKSGYAYIVKRLKRGQPLAAAVEIYRGTVDDVGAGATVLRDGENRTLPLAYVFKDAFRAEWRVIGPNGLQKIAMPLKAAPSAMVAGRVVIQTQEDWKPAGESQTFPAGSIVSIDLAKLRADPAHPRPTLIYAPRPKESIQQVSATKGVLLVSILDNVRGRALTFTPTANGAWTRSAINLPDNSAIGIADASSDDDRAFLTVTNFLTPPSVWLADARTGSTHSLHQQPAKFDASNLVSEQYEAVSSDGTRIPYFLVHRKDVTLDGNNPTLLHAYGGFEASQTPYYSATTGKLWLEKGGVYALANIRGGGEFGPAWHEAGIGTKRQIIYDDFTAVGRDMIARKLTTPRRLGISGGSNGGLLTGVAFTQHPELWNAVIIDVPLLDMLRISKIAAGASWEGEYGSVTDPAVRAFWEKTSPYQNLRKGVAYPEPFIFTTTKDDRVGPAHARKFAARMEEMGLPFYYYENTEGGHAAGANLKQTARTNALEFIYLTRKLMDLAGGERG
jgi:prolyl oligopeptidase